MRTMTTERTLRTFEITVPVVDEIPGLAEQIGQRIWPIRGVDNRPGSDIKVVEKTRTDERGENRPDAA